MRDKVLIVDEKICQKCGTCERLAPGIKTKYKGVVRISKNQYEKEEVFESARSLIDSCPSGALTLKDVQ